MTRWSLSGDGNRIFIWLITPKSGVHLRETVSLKIGLVANTATTGLGGRFRDLLQDLWDNQAPGTWREGIFPRNFFDPLRLVLEFILGRSIHMPKGASS